MQEEIWKDVKGYEELYQISSLGRVRSLPKTIKNRYGYRTTVERFLKLQKDSAGYFCVGLFLNKKREGFYVHVLVAMAFLNHKPCGYKTVVDHINNIKTDNNVNNLQLITARENLSKDRKGGTSNHIGVSWNSERCKWYSAIRVNGKSKYLGSFDCELEAAEAYQKELSKINNK